METYKLMKTYVFFRDEFLYPIELMGHADAIANAECNPGTRRVEDIRGNQIWPPKPVAVEKEG